jgi:hypothetical protein
MNKAKKIIKKYELIKEEKSNLNFPLLSIFFGLVIRFLFFTHGTFLMLFLLKQPEFKHLIYSSIFLIMILIEGVYVTFLRQGKESKYLSLCNLFYILACLPRLWTFILNDMKSISNSKNEADIQVYEKIEFNEIIFLVLIILSKWLLPRDDLDAEDTYALMLQNLSMAADTHEIFQMSEIVRKEKDFTLNMLILALWTFSLPLFVINTTTETCRNKRFRSDSKRLLEKLFGNFYWKYIVYMILMDGPYFVLRMIILVIQKEIGYENLFYISKNILQISIQIYRILRSIYFPKEILFE